MKLPFYWIDAFTDRVFAGNPAGVVPLETWPDDRVLQQIAFENGLAETAFFARRPDGGFDLRWFTPTVEVDLCGHATLAAAFVLFSHLRQSGTSVQFETRSGTLHVSRQPDGKLELDFPALAAEPEADPAVVASIASALGLRPTWIGRSRFDRLAVLSHQASLRSLKPDLTQVAAAGGRGLIVTAPGEGDCDFVSRFFAPQSGIPEDPVTGSAHCVLIPFWSARLGKTRLHARQISPRGGELWCEYHRGTGDDEPRVRLAGQAVLYLAGEIMM